MKFSDNLQDVKEFHEKVVPGLMNYKQTQVVFSGDQSSPNVKFVLTGNSKDEQIAQAKNILQSIV